MSQVREVKEESDSARKLSSPRIVCAANRFPIDDGFLIVPSPRHFDTTMHALVTQRDALKDKRKRADYEEGFIDQHGVFYDRHTAWMIAALNGQIIKRVGGDGPERGGLYSENLY